MQQQLVLVLEDIPTYEIQVVLRSLAMEAEKPLAMSGLQDTPWRMQMSEILASMRL